MNGLISTRFGERAYCKCRRQQLVPSVGFDIIHALYDCGFVADPFNHEYDMIALLLPQPDSENDVEHRTLTL